MRKPNIYVFDFESNNSQLNIDNELTNVWLWDICSLNDYSHTTGTDFNDFISVISKLAPCIMYSHNLKFDGIFILDYLLKNGFKHTTEKHLKQGEFSTLISETKVFYSIKVCIEDKNKKAKKIIEFRDSTKKLKGTVAEIAKSHDLPILKGEIDYKAYRPYGYIPTDDEIAYIRNDTEIIARALKPQYENGMDKLTTASDTLALFKKHMGKYFQILFPTISLKEDTFIRNAYRGGLVLVDERRCEKIIKQPVYVYDVNSMYPYQMAEKPLPYGTPVYYLGKYKKDNKYTLYIQRIEVCCKLKENYKPTVLLKNRFYQKQLSYLTDTEGQMIELTLTSVDMELLYKHYEIFDIKYIDGYMFLSSTKLMRSFIKPLYEKKCTTKGAEKERYKLLLNALYGKFATNPKHIGKIPYLENDKVCFKNGPVEIGKPIYTALSAFVTAYSRQQLLNTIQNNYDNFVYCDTDSIHLLGEIQGEIVDDKKLGAYKLEKIYTISKYLAQKTYYGITAENKKDIKIAGCPKNVKEKISFENFNFENSFDGKLLPKTVNGGVVLIEHTFTLKRR